MALDPRTLVSSLLRFDDDVVLLVVGPEAKRLVVHRSHLEHTSSFFQSCFKEQWKEGQEQKVTLPEEDPTIVTAYLNFLYSGKILCKAIDGDTSGDESAHDAEYHTLIQLYCFGEKYQDIQLKNAAIDAMLAKAQVRDADGKGWFPTGREVDVLYKGTCAGCLGRKLVVDMHIREAEAGWVREEVNNSEFLGDLAHELLAIVNQQHLGEQGAEVYRGHLAYNNCEYHEHEPGHACAAAKPG